MLILTLYVSQADKELIWPYNTIKGMGFPIHPPFAVYELVYLPENKL